MEGDNSFMEGDKALLLLAKNTILKTKFRGTLDFGRWNKIKSGSFVTAYHNKGNTTSENVWCCMSNGEYTGDNFVPQNVQESATICATRDSRRTVRKPQMFAVDILIPKPKWRKVTVTQLSRARNRTIAVELSKGHTAIYLPSVWNERPEWGPEEFIENLTRKAGRGTVASRIKNIYEIDTYEITETGSHNYGYFKPSAMENPDLNGGSKSNNFKPKKRLLQNIWNFYQKHAKGKTGPLAYMIKNDGKTISYQNEGAFVRTFSDLATYLKIARVLEHYSKRNGPGPRPSGMLREFSIPGPGNDYLKDAQNRVTQEIKRLRPLIRYKNASILAGWIELLLTADPNKYNQEICQATIKLIKLQAKTPGIFGTSDLAFANPQALLALLNVIDSTNCYNEMTLEDINLIVDHFLQIYTNPKIYYELFQKDPVNASFGANWVTQALIKAYQLTDNKRAKRFVENKMVPILKEALQAKRSITQEAIATHALLVANKQIYRQALLSRWDRLQKKWGLGGFRYYEKQPWYRTDVTSHVGEVLLKLLEKN